MDHQRPRSSSLYGAWGRCQPPGPRPFSGSFGIPGAPCYRLSLQEGRPSLRGRNSEIGHTLPTGRGNPGAKMRPVSLGALGRGTLPARLLQALAVSGSSPGTTRQEPLPSGCWRVRWPSCWPLPVSVLQPPGGTCSALPPLEVQPTGGGQSPSQGLCPAVTPGYSHSGLPTVLECGGHFLPQGPGTGCVFPTYPTHLLQVSTQMSPVSGSHPDHLSKN